MANVVQEKRDIDDGIQWKEGTFNKALAPPLKVGELVLRVRRIAGWLVAERPTNVFENCGLARAATANESVVLGIEVENNRAEKFAVRDFDACEPDGWKPRLRV